MLHLHFTPSLDLLVPELLAALRTTWTDPLAPPTVIVPSPAIGKWLRLRLADGNAGAARHEPPFGCVAGLAMQTLERFLWKTLRPDPDMELLDVGRLRQVVFALLDREAEHRDNPLRSYLLSSDGTTVDPLKQVQLSARIAYQFLEYEYNRPSVWNDARQTWRRLGMDACWLGNRNYFDRELPHESWQKSLYCRAMACLSSGSDGNRPRLVSLPHLYRKRREEHGKAGTRWAAHSGPVFLFGVTKVSHFHRNTLVELSQMDSVSMELFLTNPCAEFWEDIDTRRTRAVRRSWKHDSIDAGIKQRKPEDYDREELREIAELPDDHPLLEQWGAAGKENIFLWCPQAQWNFDYHGGDATGEFPATLLSAVQQSLLQAGARLPGRGASWQDDGTLRLLACPDRGREIEEIREQILDLIQEKKIERPGEVAVYITDPAAYLPHIERVFGASRPGDHDHLPFAVLGMPGGDSLVAQGIAIVLDMAGGRFDRPRLFALLRNLVIRRKRRISDRQIALWERWAENLGMFRGVDRDHRKEMGDCGDAITDAHTFGFGIARLLIGPLAATPVALPFRLPGDRDATEALPVPPFGDFDTSDDETVETFCATVEELYDDLRSLGAKNGTTDIRDGVAALATLAEKWFGSIPDDAAVNVGAETVACRAFIDSLEQLLLQNRCAGRDTLPFETFLLLAASCIPKELPAAAFAWTVGITFAPLRPAMVVPHRAIFVAGLDASAFPGTADRPGWDLLSTRRIVGDSDPVADQRFAFLEILHAARERLILSYRARDLQKEEDLQPSSVLLELESFLISQGIVREVDGQQICGIRRAIPWIVHESLASVVPDGHQTRSWDPVATDLAQRHLARNRVAHRHDLCPAVARSPAAFRPKATLPELRLFFANPLEYHLSRSLGLGFDEDVPTMDAVDEPLATGPLARSTLEKTVWADALELLFPVTDDDAAMNLSALAAATRNAAVRVYDAHIAGGHSPEGQFCRTEKKRFLEWSLLCAKAAMNLRERFCSHRLMKNSDLSLGREGTPGALSLVLHNGSSYDIECNHALVLVPRSTRQGGEIAIVDVQKEGRAADNEKLWLAGVVQTLAESRQSPGLGVVLAQFNRGDGEKKKTGVDFSVMKKPGDSDNDIEGWLRDLTCEMQAGNCSDHLPFAVVQKIFSGDWSAITGSALTDELEREHSAYRSYLEAFRLADARIPQIDDDLLRATARRRFAPLLERWLHE